MNSAVETSFVQTLLQSARPHPIAENPFVAAMRRGECTREQVRAYAETIAIAAIGAFAYFAIGYEANVPERFA